MKYFDTRRYVLYMLYMHFCENMQKRLDWSIQLYIQLVRLLQTYVFVFVFF